MNRIISPLNIASFIFLVIIFICWDQSNRADKREQRQQEETEYIASLKAITADQIIERINGKMPVKCNDWMKPCFRSAAFEGDALVLKATDVDEQNPTAIGWITLGNDARTATLALVAKSFEPGIIDYLVLHNYGLKLVFYDSKGKYNAEWSMTPNEVLSAYSETSFERHSNAPLRNYLNAKTE